MQVLLRILIHILDITFFHLTFLLIVLGMNLLFQAVRVLLIYHVILQILLESTVTVQEILYQVAKSSY